MDSPSLSERRTLHGVPESGIGTGAQEFLDLDLFLSFFVGGHFRGRAVGLKGRGSREKDWRADGVTRSGKECKRRPQVEAKKNEEEGDLTPDLAN